MKIILNKILKMMGCLFNKMADKSAERVLKYYNILENKQGRRWDLVLKNAKVKERGNTNTKRRKRNEKKFMDVDCIDADLFGDHTFICR
jgi:hypothetical protein